MSSVIESKVSKKNTHPSRPMHAREQLERLYREIGIPALASAAHMAALQPPKPAKPQHDIPAILRDESLAA